MSLSSVRLLLKVYLSQIQSILKDLLCFIENIFFTLKFRPNSQATFMKRKIDLAEPGGQVIPRGTLVTVRVQLKVGRPPRVMYLLPEDERGEVADLEEAMRKIEGLGARICYD